MATESITQHTGIKLSGEQHTWIQNRLNKAVALLDVLAEGDLENCQTKGINHIADASIVALMDVFETLEKAGKDERESANV